MLVFHVRLRLSCVSHRIDRLHIWSHLALVDELRDLGELSRVWLRAMSLADGLVCLCAGLRCRAGKPGSVPRNGADEMALVHGKVEAGSMESSRKTKDKEADEGGTNMA